METLAAPLVVTKTAVRRFLLEQQGLHIKTPTKTVKADDVLQLVQKLECVQLDPVAAVARNQHLVLAARLGRYQPETLEQLLAQGRVFEYWVGAACVIPMEDYPIFEVTRKRIEQSLQPQLDKLGWVIEDVMRRLEAEGPLPSKAFESKERVHGYWENGHAEPKTKATSLALNLLNDMGRIMVVRREGTARYFDIPARHVPKHLLEQASIISEGEAKAALLDKYMRAFRVFDTGDGRFGWQRMSASERRQAVAERVEQGSVIPMTIEDVKRPYFIRTEDVDALMRHTDASGGGDHNRWVSTGIRFIPPLDNLLWRRERIEDLFDFSYTWEVYTPAVKRTYGYYAMPILDGDRFIGRLDPRLDRDHARLHIQLLQIEPHIRWTKTLENRVHRALQEFAALHQAELGRIERIWLSK